MIFPDKFFENKTKVILALLLPAFILYFKSFKFDFTTLDEQWMIVKNTSLLHGWTPLKEAFSNSISGLYYRPFLTASIVIDYRIGQLSPAIYHITNLLLHLSCVLLLFKFLRFNDASKQNAFIYSLIFSVHPALLHAIAWVPGRNDLLLCLFTLASLIFLLQFLKAPEKKYMVLHLLFFTCALLTKENAIVLPLIFIGTYLIHKKFKRKETWLLITAWLLLSLAWLYLRNRIVEVPAPTGISLAELLKNFIPAMLLYTGKALIPIQQSILPMLKHASIIPGLLAVAVLCLLAFKPGVKSKPVAALGLLIFFILLAMPVWYSTVKNGAEHYEHRLYTSMTGMVLFFSQLKFNTGSKPFLYAAGLVFCLLFIKTYARMDVYKNKEEFLSAGVKEAPGFYLFLFQRSEVFYEQGNYDSSIAYCSRALAIRPDKSEIYSNRGSSYYMLGAYREAIADFTKAIETSASFNYQYYLNRCIVYNKAGDIGSAVKDFLLLKKCCQPYIPEHIEKEVVDNFMFAVDAFNKKLQADPHNAGLFYQRAVLLFNAEHEEEGWRDITSACEIDPANPEYKKLYLAHEKLNKK